jgi:aspartate-semialdehyde dehydrogenase
MRSTRIVIAGASSLLGAELKELLEESRFAGADFRLVDEEMAAGTLTEAGGEPVVIQPVDEDSFARAQIVFFTGSSEFTVRNAGAARRAGARVIDLSGGLAGESGTRMWMLPGPAPAGQSIAGEQFCVPGVPGSMAAMLALGLRRAGLKRLAVVFYRPVAEAGRFGIEEMEEQTRRLLTFQPAGGEVFGTQVAFSMADRYGESSAENLARERTRIQREVTGCLGVAGGSGAVQPSVQVVHTPVFFGYMFSAWAELAAEAAAADVAAACREAGFAVAEAGAAAPGNVNVAGETGAQISWPEGDAGSAGAWWLWGGADNVKFPATQAVRLAERLL